MFGSLEIDSEAESERNRLSRGERRKKTREEGEKESG